MKIRTRITLVVGGAGFIASLLLSLGLIYELLQQPFRILHATLHEEAAMAVQIYNKGEIWRYEEEGGAVPTVWLEIYDADTGRKLYASPLARSVDLNTVRFEGSGLVGTILATAPSNSRYKTDAQGMYMARDFEITDKGKKFHVQIANEMDQLADLNEKTWEVFRVVASSLLFVIFVLFILGRGVAGKIIRPIRQIRDLAQNISDQNFSERVPVGAEQDEIRELAETVNGMLDRLQLSFQRQKEFLFDTSHELKTPLTTMRLAVQELCRDDLSLP